MALAPDRAAIKALEDALAAVLATVGNNPSPAVVRRIREGLAAHADAVEAARSATDPIRMPQSTFDPADPKAIGRMVSIALLAQPLFPLGDVRPAYGSGVYAIYYRGDHPLYKQMRYQTALRPASGDRQEYQVIKGLASSPAQWRWWQKREQNGHFGHFRGTITTH